MIQLLSIRNDSNLACCIEPVLQNLLLRIPALVKCRPQQLLKNYEAFSADGRPVFGHLPGVSNYFIAMGMEVAAYSLAGGLSRALAEWLVTGSLVVRISTYQLQKASRELNSQHYTIY